MLICTRPVEFCVKRLACMQKDTGEAHTTPSCPGTPRTPSSHSLQRLPRPRTDVKFVSLFLAVSTAVAVVFAYLLRCVL
jgi:hypothetical protein